MIKCNRFHHKKSKPVSRILILGELKLSYVLLKRGFPHCLHYTTNSFLFCCDWGIKTRMWIHRPPMDIGTQEGVSITGGNVFSLHLRFPHSRSASELTYFCSEVTLISSFQRCTYFPSSGNRTGLWFLIFSYRRTCRHVALAIVVL